MITVLTPTYNRSKTLVRLYQSLQEQTVHDFEWLIIDDGSSDNTEEILEIFKQDTKFPIRTIYQKNSGKHVAINSGVVVANGDWIFIVDSDDALSSDAVSKVIESLSRYKSDNLTGVCFRRAYFDNNIIGVTSGLPGKLLNIKPTEAGRLLQGDLAYIFKKTAMVKFPFPVFDGEKFVPELYIWNKIGDIGDILFFSEDAIYYCEYLLDGYSHNFKLNLKKNPRGFLHFYKTQIFREKWGISKLKCIIRTLQCCFYVSCKTLQRYFCIK